jgi:hypothetical protein
VDVDPLPVATLGWLCVDRLTADPFSDEVDHDVVLALFKTDVFDIVFLTIMPVPTPGLSESGCP